MVAVAIGGAAVLGVASSAIGASAQTSAADKAAAAQGQAAQTASQTEQQFYNENQQILNPYIQGGDQAYATLNNLLGVGGNSSTMQSTLESLPGYQFTLNQGLESVQNGYAARGLGSSGAALKGAANYATGLANSTYGNYVTQLQNSANTGENAANALAGYGTTAGGQIASNQIGAGNAAAAAYNTGGAAAANAANTIGNTGTSLASLYTLNNVLSANNQSNSGANSFFDMSQDE